MEDNKNNYKKVTTWDMPILGVLLFLAGTITFIKGMAAYQTGELISPTTKSSWMTGPQALIVGTIMAFAGIGLLLIEIKKRRH